MDPLVKNTISYEEWITERLKDNDDELIIYLEATLEVFREDRDIGSLLFALKAVLIAKGYEGKPITLDGGEHGE